jgi:TonB-linked SusC/RagA family outer membrane protein
VQEVGGDEFSQAKETNVVRSLAGKVAGVQVTSSNAMGGSSKVLLRGASSITGENQPLFVVDGVPVDNSNFTTANQERDAGGYDYGNAIQDLNPNDIESVTVLKGPAAAALYGSRASNGAIVITTKTGKSYAASGRRGVGVEVNTGVSFQNVFVIPDYQNSYGGGAGDEFIGQDDNGVNIPDMGYDGSWGPALNGQAARHWDSWYEGDTFGEVRPWSANPDNVKDFFQTGVTYSNNVALVGATDASSFRLSYTNLDQTGTYENASLGRNTINFSGTSQLSERLSASVSVNYVNTQTTGRPLTGYGESIMSQFTQWFQRQVDMERLRDYKQPDGSQRTWNRNSTTDGGPHYWDNPFWERYENVQNDERNRVFGNFSVNYKLNDMWSVTGRAMTDFYNDTREERVAVGGVRVPLYSQANREVRETNLDLLLNFNKQLNEDLSLTGFVGGNQRLFGYSKLSGATQGGLNTPGYYNLANSASEVLIDDYSERKKVNSVFGTASLGYKNTLYVDFTARNDWSSTLPEENNSYFYPSVTGSYVFSENLDIDWLSFGKVRVGWASVGNDSDPYKTTAAYVVNPNFGTSPNASVPNALFNADLKPELTKSIEFGAELNFFLNRVRLDFTYYTQTTEDLIFSVSQSAATGYSSRILNAGTVENKGIEVMLNVTPVKTESGFTWDLGLNFAKNNNQLVSLVDGVENLRYTSLFGVSLEARVGEPLGTFMGFDYQYDDAGNKLVDADGVYLTTDEIVPLGTILPDFTGGVTNTLTYKGLTFYALIDFQKGGSLHSYSNQWGKYSGTLAETAENNIREEGIVVEGVYAPGTIIDDVDVSGQANSSVLDAQSHFFLNQGYVVHAADQYDASFIKLREMRLNYSLPAKMTEGLPFYSVSVGVYGRNLAILHKNVPHVDPEVASASGNIQGFEGGQLPAERTIGVNLSFKL